MATIVCIGDSIVEGEGDEEGLSGWAGRLQRELLKGAAVGQTRVYNLGMGMETSIDLMHRFFSEVLYRDPDLIIMQAAHGDSRYMFNQSRELEYEIGKGARLRSYHKVFKYLSASGKKVLILGLNPVSSDSKFNKPTNQRSEHIDAHNKGLKTLCQEYGLQFLDPRTIFSSVDLSKHYADGLHPNAAGYDVMYKEILKKLKELRYIK